MASLYTQLAQLLGLPSTAVGDPMVMWLCMVVFTVFLFFTVQLVSRILKGGEW